MSDWFRREKLQSPHQLVKVSVMPDGEALAARGELKPPLRVKFFYSLGEMAPSGAFNTAIPFVFFAFRKPSWKAADSDFEPFEWQIEGRQPNKTAA